ncbi:MAG: protein-disulfide reductase DsbD domain-containing protein [Bacteroidota bacterium]
MRVDPRIFQHIFGQSTTINLDRVWNPVKVFYAGPRTLLTSMLLLAIVSLQGQIETAARWNTQLSPAGPYEVGQEVDLKFEVSIDKGYHIYAANQPEGSPVLPTVFSLDDESKGVELIGGLTEKGKKIQEYDDIFEADLAYFKSSVTFTQKIKITDKGAKIVGPVSYQVCDDSRCIPAYEEVELALEVAGSASPAPQQETATPPQESGSPASAPADPETPSESPSSAEATPNEVPSYEVIQAPGLPPVVQPEGEMQPKGLLDPVKWEVKDGFPEASPKVGDVYTLVFKGKIDEGYYIYSSIEPEKPANLPTIFTLDTLNSESRGVELTGKLTEDGKRKSLFDDIYETTLYYYKNEVTFSQQLTITEENPDIVGSLSYQVCNEGTCVNKTVEIEKRYGKAASTIVPVVEKEVEPVIGEKEEKSLWAMFFESFAFGLAALFTPCIFPMIPLTVSFFTKQSQDRAKGIRNATFYGLSIVAIYTILGLMVSILVGPETMQKIAINPYVNIAFFLLIFVFALSFLGMFEITLPASWSTALGKNSDQGGLLGIFFMAMTLAVVSFSCTGPLVSTALFQAASGKSYLGPTVSMLGFSSAIAIPFALFALFPGMMNSLPRSGGWLNSVKVTLGFLELALAMTYLSNADLVWHLGILDREIFVGAWVVIFVMLGVYLLGGLQLPHDSPLKKLSWFRLGLGAASMGFAFYLFPGLYGAPLRLLGGFLPEVNPDMGVVLNDAAAVLSEPSWHKGLLDREVVVGMGMVLFGFLGMFLLNKLPLPIASQAGERVKVPQLIAAMTSFWIVLYLLPGLTGAPLPLLSGILPPVNNDMGVVLVPGQEQQSSDAIAGICNYPDKKHNHLASHSPRGFCAFYDLEQGLAYAREQGKPVFLDFTGHTCKNCRYLEKNAWPDAEIRRFITEEYVLISLYTDDKEQLEKIERGRDGSKLRTVGDKWLQYEKEVYYSNAQPWYVLLDHNEKLLLPSKGYSGNLDLQEYRTFFKKGLEEFKKRQVLTER